MDSNISVKMEPNSEEIPKVNNCLTEQNQIVYIDKSICEDIFDIKTEPVELESYDADLYIDHQVKEEIVIGPTQLQKQDMGYLPNQNFPCANCKKSYKYKSSLTRHMYTAHNITTDKKNQEEEHPRKRVKKKINRDGFKSIECGVCYKNFVNVANLKRHMKICPMLIKNINNNAEDLETKEDIKKEIEVIVKKEENNNKELDGNFDDTENLDAYENHEKLDFSENHENLVSENQCRYCFKMFTLPNNLYRHMKHFHSTDKKYSCDKCHMKFARPDYLNRHKLIRHSEGNILYCKCGRKFFDKWNLRRHKKGYCQLKSCEIKLICDYCNRVFCNKYKLTEHIKAHLNKKFKNLICDYCQKRFNKKFDIERHMHQHLKLNLPMYHCEICDKKFVRNYSLKKHLIAHSGKKPFSCQYCGRRFGSKWGCSSHEKLNCQLKE